MTITVKELIKELKQFNPEALVYVYADHGQLEEQSQGVRIQNTNEFDPEIEIRTTRRRR